MQETGVVTETMGDMAVVKVKRLVPNGCGCGVTNLNEETLVEVRNLCNARVNDRVYLNSNHDIQQLRNTVKMGVPLLVFAVTGVAAERVLTLLDFNAWVKPLALSLGLAFGLITFAVIQRYYKKRPVPLSAARGIA
ncbi:MAG: SoxR reducing system RseC family protein [Treponema sp.]|jgi:hypothetical protein|nr:SoxR reducing system RseC family protein [Treponema sp.]